MEIGSINDYKIIHVEHCKLSRPSSLEDEYLFIVSLGFFLSARVNAELACSWRQFSPVLDAEQQQQQREKHKLKLYFYPLKV